MHEAPLMMDLMRRIDEVAQAEGARHVVGVSIWIGALSHMSAEHLAEHFKRAAAGTIAEGAHLDMTLSSDVHHANAQNILLENVKVEV